MKFRVNSYHYNLLKDYERLSAFGEAIYDFTENYEGKSAEKTAFDLGCGSGVMSYFASDYFDKIISLEKEPKIAHLARENLKGFSNIEVLNADALDFDFKEKADLIICEMLDTALIDEEEVPVLNHAREFLKDEGRIIPQSVINVAEPVFMENHYIQYEDTDSHPRYDILGRFVVYSDIDFFDEIDEEFHCNIRFSLFDKEFFNSDKFNGEFFNSDKVSEEFFNSDKVSEEFFNSDKFGEEFFNSSESEYSLRSSDENRYLKVNGIKITSFTRLDENIICGPTPMLNPSILVPFDEIRLNAGESFEISLSYTMGGGLESVKAEVTGVF